MNILELRHNFELDLGNVIRYGSFKYALYKQKLLAFLFESIFAFLQLLHILAILQLFSHIKSNLFYTYLLQVLHGKAVFRGVGCELCVSELLPVVHVEAPCAAPEPVALGPVLPSVASLHNKWIESLSIIY